MVSDSFAKRFAGRIDVVSKEGNFEEGGGGLKVNHDLLNSLMKEAKPSKEKPSKEKPSKEKTRSRSQKSTASLASAVRKENVCDNREDDVLSQNDENQPPAHVIRAQPLATENVMKPQRITVDGDNSARDSQCQPSPNTIRAVQRISVTNGQSEERPTKLPSVMTKVTQNSYASKPRVSKIVPTNSYAVANGYARMQPVAVDERGAQESPQQSPDRNGFSLLAKEPPEVETQRSDTRPDKPFQAPQVIPFDYARPDFGSEPLKAADYVNIAKKRMQEDNFAMSASDYATAAKQRVVQEVFPPKKPINTVMEEFAAPTFDALDMMMRTSSSSSQQDLSMPEIVRHQRSAPQSTVGYTNPDEEQGLGSRAQVKRGRTVSPRQRASQGRRASVPDGPAPLPARSGRRASVPNGPTLPPLGTNDHMVKSEKDRLFFSKKPRPVEYVPAKLGEYQAKYSGKMELKSLGPDLENEDLLLKKARAAQIKEFSKQLRDVNKQRISTKQSDKPKPKELSKRDKAKQFATTVPKPKIPDARGLKLKPELVEEEKEIEEVEEVAEPDSVDVLCEQWNKHLEHKSQVDQIKNFLKDI